ncbi:unnamed protein product [Cuscuta epithymum]|uniref:HMA domain-containing protein n=1 Tax=Cuscuta epithymum TaxID=186058 RepID=A0AAV0G021_9ASTE|nr:unnamed protein product [Cuscuta epithymum]
MDDINNVLTVTGSAGAVTGRVFELMKGRRGGYPKPHIDSLGAKPAAKKPDDAAAKKDSEEAKKGDGDKENGKSNGDSKIEIQVVVLDFKEGVGDTGLAEAMKVIAEYPDVKSISRVKNIFTVTGLSGIADNILKHVKKRGACYQNNNVKNTKVDTKSVPVEKEKKKANDQSKKVVLKLDANEKFEPEEAEKYMQAAMEIVAGLEGLDSLSIDVEKRLLTVTGIANPGQVLVRLRVRGSLPYQRTTFVSVGPKKAEDKPKQPDSKTTKGPTNNPIVNPVIPPAPLGYYNEDAYTPFYYDPPPMHPSGGYGWGAPPPFKSLFGW